MAAFGWIFYALILYAIYLLLLLSIPYLAFQPNVDFLLTKQFIYHIDSWRISFYTHVFSSIFVIFTGLFQFNKYTIKKQPKLHRTFGYIYFVILIFISAPSALVLALYANGGFLAQLSFTTLTTCWMIFTLIAYYQVRRKNYVSHGKFLLRSYALTLSAVSLRLYMYLFDVFKMNMHPVDTYIMVSYLSWIPNLLIAEILIRRGYIEKLYR